VIHRARRTPDRSTANSETRGCRDRSVAGGPFDHCQRRRISSTMKLQTVGCRRCRRSECACGCLGAFDQGACQLRERCFTSLNACSHCATLETRYSITTGCARIGTGCLQVRVRLAGAAWTSPVLPRLAMPAAVTASPDVGQHTHNDSESIVRGTLRATSHRLDIDTGAQETARPACLVERRYIDRGHFERGALSSG
jgi:hypothetical protein